jgi:hypothetical protein
MKVVDPLRCSDSLLLKLDAQFFLVPLFGSIGFSETKEWSFCPAFALRYIYGKFRRQAYNSELFCKVWLNRCDNCPLLVSIVEHSVRIVDVQWLNCCIKKSSVNRCGPKDMRFSPLSYIL